MKQTQENPTSFAVTVAIADAKEHGQPAPVIFVYNHCAAPCHCVERGYECEAVFSIGTQEPVYIYSYKVLCKLMRKHGWMVSRTAFFCPKHSSRTNAGKELQYRRNMLCEAIRQAAGDLNRQDAHAAVDAVFTKKEKP